MKLFVSYSSRDGVEAQTLEQFARKQGFEVEKPTHSKRQEQGVDEAFNRDSEQKLKGCNTVLFVVSPFWQASKLAQMEIEWAQASGVALIAVVTSPVPATNFAADVELVDLTLDKKAGMDKLLEVLQRINPGSAKAQQPAVAAAPEAAFEHKSRKPASPLDDVSFPPRPEPPDPGPMPKMEDVKPPEPRPEHARRPAGDPKNKEGGDESNAVVPANAKEATDGEPLPVVRTTTFEYKIRNSVKQARAALHTKSLPDWLRWAQQKPVTKNPQKAETREAPPHPKAELLEPGDEGPRERQAGGETEGEAAAQQGAGRDSFQEKLVDSYIYIRADKKRTAIAASLAGLMIALVGWGLFGGVSEEARIREELQNVKSRQALFLSKISAHLLAGGDREAAMLMALEAVEQSRVEKDADRSGERTGDEREGLEAQVSLYAAWLHGQDGLEFNGHGNHVSSVAFSPDGKFVLSASWDETVRLWDIHTGRQALALEGHDSLVNSAAFSPDQKMLITAAVDRKARLFDVATGRLLHVFSGHTDDLTDAIFSPNGKFIATASADHTAQLWDLASKKPLVTFMGHKKGVESLAFNPDGSRLATASDDHTVRIYNTKSGSPVATLVGHEGPVRSVAYDSSGGYIVTASEDHSARLWNAYTGRQVRRFMGHKWAVLGAAFSKDGKYVVTASKDNTARVFETATGRTLMVLKGHRGIVTDAAFSPDGSRIATASGDGGVRLWPLILSRKKLAQRVRADVRSCLSLQSRRKYFLSEEPPAWCIELKKPPFNTAAWRRWLKAKKAGRNSVMPKEG